MKWEESEMGTPVLYSENREILAVLNKTAWSLVNGQYVPKYGLSTQDYMSQWEDIVFDDLDVAKREAERVITERKLMVDDILYEAKVLPNGSIVFLSDVLAPTEVTRT
ncbi:hypothetical protein [Paenibacillus taichungensis]